MDKEQQRNGRVVRALADMEMGSHIPIVTASMILSSFDMDPHTLPSES